MIGLAGTVIGAGIPMLSVRASKIRNDAYDKVTGSITDPQPHSTISRTFTYSGTVTGMQSGLCLRLAVEVGERVWPKEGRIQLDQNNKWSVTMFEDGAAEVISVALYVVDASADRSIEQWLERGQRFGRYVEMHGIPRARRIARVDDLRLRPS